MGNRLLEVPGADPGARYRVQFYHHKNSKRWDGKAITFFLPAGLETLTETWLAARPLVAKEECHNLLVGPRGGALDHSAWSARFKAILKKRGAPFSFPPRTLRCIYIEDRVALSAHAPGPAPEAAAMVSFLGGGGLRVLVLRVLGRLSLPSRWWGCVRACVRVGGVRHSTRCVH